MSRRKIIINRCGIIISLFILAPLWSMEELEHQEEHEEHHEAPAATTQASTGKSAAATTTSGQLTWQDQQGSEKAAGEGMTNINESRGNWFFKNKIGKDARTLNVNIKKKLQQFSHYKKNT